GCHSVSLLTVCSQDTICQNKKHFLEPIMRPEFRNEPFTDFTKEENAQAMRAALEKVKSELGREYPLVIGGERITTDGKVESINPANRTQVVGRFNKATKELATRAVDTAYETFKTWRKTPAAERADCLCLVADK